MDSRDPARPCLVVGYDGSSSSRAAVRLAAGRAGDAGTVYLVHTVPAAHERTGYATADRRMAEHQRELGELRETLPAEGARLQADGRLEWEVLTDEPARAILEVASVRDADEIVVGSRGRGRAGSLLGSVTHELLHSADRPVLVVPERAVEP